MKLININSTSPDLLRFVLRDIVPEPILSSIMTAQNHSQHIIANDIIDEGFLGNMIYGGLLKARAALTTLPDSVKQNPKITKLIKRAEELPGTLLDNTNNNWWVELVGIFHDSFADGRAFDYKQIALAIKQKIADEAQQWVDNTKERGDFDKTYAQTKTSASRRHQLQKLLNHYGGSDKNDSEPNNSLKGIDLNDRDQLGKLIHKLSLRYKALSKIAKEDAVKLLLAMSGTVLSEADWNNIGAKMVDMFNPKRRQGIAHGFINRAQNKLLAVMAIKAAYEMSSDISSRKTQNAPIRKPRVTQLGSKSDTTNNKTKLRSKTDTVQNKTRLKPGSDSPGNKAGIR